jgi:hypothetical protein
VPIAYPTSIHFIGNNSGINVSINLFGMLLNSDASGTLATGGRLQNVQISTSSTLLGSLTLSGAGGVAVTVTGLNGISSGADLFGPVFFQLSNAADVGKARVTWSAT